MALSPHSDRAIHFLRLDMARLKKDESLDNHIKSRAALPFRSHHHHRTQINFSPPHTQYHRYTVSPGGYIYLHTSGWPVCDISGCLNHWANRKKWHLWHKCWAWFMALTLTGDKQQGREQSHGPAAWPLDDIWDYTSRMTAILYIIQLIMTNSIYTKCCRASDKQRSLFCCRSFRSQLHCIP